MDHNSHATDAFKEREKISICIALFGKRSGEATGRRWPNAYGGNGVKRSSIALNRPRTDSIVFRNTMASPPSNES
jgi:hypothetical protein